ncbi:MAG: nucleotidyltransferase domain-containing protein [Muribaculaceae bacterium]|nr:nucleotidyltransferase domain-containing protein [Muribaculaceae bacterium]
MKLIELNLEKIYELCRKYKVKTLSVFGSILTDRFNDESDIDLLVDFEPFDPDSLEFDYVTNYIDLQESLEKLLSRKVDLIVDGSHLNSYFRYCINKRKQLIYG